MEHYNPALNVPQTSGQLQGRAVDVLKQLAGHVEGTQEASLIHKNWKNVLGVKYRFVVLLPVYGSC